MVIEGFEGRLSALPFSIRDFNMARKDRWRETWNLDFEPGAFRLLAKN